MVHLKNKAGFLEYKIAYRWFKDKKNESNYIEKPTKCKGEFYRAFLTKLDEHNNFIEKKNSTEGEINIKQLLEYLNKINSSNLKPTLDEFSLERFHHLNKYFRKLKKASKINELIEIIEGANNSALHLFDKIAFKSCNNLLFNSALLIDLGTEEDKNFANILKDFKNYFTSDKDTPNSIFLTEIINRVQKFEENKNISDYYSHVILLKFYNKLINYLRSNPEDIVVLNAKDLNDVLIGKLRGKLDSLIAYLSELYQEQLLLAETNLKKMRTHEVKAICLTFKECITPYTWKDGTKGNLFLDSSYILPIDYEKLNMQINSWENYVFAQLNPLKNRFEMALGIIYIDQKNITFENKVKENEFKVVQIVAMFVSIATFVLINVKIFDNKSAIDSFAIILGLAACFFLFNSFFYFIILANQRDIPTWKFILKSLTFLIVPLIFGKESYDILSREGVRTNIEIKNLQDKIKCDSAEIRKLIELNQLKTNLIIKSIKNNDSL